MGIIERLRRESSLSQAEASKISGMNIRIWSRAENGKSITLNTLKKMTLALPGLKNVLLKELINFQ